MKKTDCNRAVSVLADDLTGSTDSVVQFREAGWAAYLLLTDDPPPGLTNQHGPVAIARSLDTRSLSTSEAAARTAQAVAKQLAAGTDRLYLKIDSTMRGSVAGQVAGALQAWARCEPETFAVICPAYPNMGRVIVDGRMLVNDVPLNESAAAHDPVTPVTTAVLTELVPGAIHIPSGGTSTELADQIAKAAAPGARIIVDAKVDPDLDILARAIDQLGPRAVAVGSAGLARQLAQVWLPADAPHLPPWQMPSNKESVVVAMTSLNEVSRDQANHLARSLGKHLARYELPLAALRDADELRTRPRDILSHSSARVILLQPTAERVLSGDPTELARSIASGVAATVAGLVGTGKITGLILVGGDGAEASLAQLEAAALRVEGSASEGVPVGRIVGGPAAGLAVATKAGGFGTPSTLTHVVNAMLDAEEDSK